MAWPPFGDRDGPYLGGPDDRPLPVPAVIFLALWATLLVCSIVSGILRFLRDTNNRRPEEEPLLGDRSVTSRGSTVPVYFSRRCDQRGRVKEMALLAQGHWFAFERSEGDNFEIVRERRTTASERRANAALARDCSPRTDPSAGGTNLLVLIGWTVEDAGTIDATIDLHLQRLFSAPRRSVASRPDTVSAQVALRLLHTVVKAIVAKPGSHWAWYEACCGTPHVDVMPEPTKSILADALHDRRGVYEEEERWKRKELNTFDRFLSAFGPADSMSAAQPPLEDGTPPPPPPPPPSDAPCGHHGGHHGC